MKNIRKVLALGLVFVMLFSMAVVAFAEGGHTITINNADAGYTYAAYQIFTGTLSGTGAESDPYVLTGIQWGSAVKAEALSDGKLTLTGLADGKAMDAAEWAAWLQENTTSASAFAKAIKSSLGDATKTSTWNAGSKNYTISDLADGYYLVENTTVPDKNGAYTDYILSVVGDDAQIDKKSDYPKVDKEVLDTGDVGDGWGETADHDIGDRIQYRITGTLPDNLDSYKTYKYIFTDNMSKGLTYKNDVKVYAVKDNQKIEISSEDYEATYVASDAKYEGGHVLTVKFDDLKTAKGANGETLELDETWTIVVEYTAVLNEHAVIAGDGNPNVVDLEYSNNPNKSGDGDEDNETGKTPEDVVIVYTYELDVDKTQPNGDSGTKPLAGAKFALYQYDPEGKVDPADPNTNPAPQHESGAWVKVGNATSDAEGKLNFKGLDDGEYKLVETEAPAGFNTAADVVFTIDATHNTTEGQESLGEVTVTGNDKVTQSKKGNGHLQTEVLNQKGTTLPSTGGIGTTIFYVIGGLMVLCAGVLLITKRRMKSED